MFLIPTYVAPSKIHGMGVFTAVDIKKGTVIWRYDDSVDQKFTKNEFSLMIDSLSDENFKKFESWTYFENGVYILCGDNAKFCNHCEENPSFTEIYGIMESMAHRDIKINEELTCNYKDFDDNDRRIEGKLYE